MGRAKETRKFTDRSIRSLIWGLAEPILGFSDKTVTEEDSCGRRKFSETTPGAYEHALNLPVPLGDAGTGYSPLIHLPCKMNALLEHVSLPGAPSLLLV